MEAVKNGDDFTILPVEAEQVLSQKSGVITVYENEDEDEVAEKFYMTDDAVIYVIEGDEVDTMSAKKMVALFDDDSTGTIYAVMNDDAECTALYIYAVKTVEAE